MVKLSSKAKESLKQHGQLEAQRSEVIQQMHAAKADENSAAEQLKVQRSSTEIGAGASERLRRATVKFEEAEQQREKASVTLSNLNGQIVQLESALQTQANNVLKQLLEETAQAYDEAATALQSVAQRFVAYKNQLGLSIPPNIEMFLKVPRLEGFNGFTAPMYDLIPRKPENGYWVDVPIRNAIAEEQIQEVKGIIDASISASREAKLYRQEQQNAQIAKRQQDAADEQKDVAAGRHRHVRHI